MNIIRVPCRHNDSTTWRDEPAEDGRVRVVCRTCGKFIGYRRAVQRAGLWERHCAQPKALP
jgi:hypothetical protein